MAAFYSDSFQDYGGRLVQVAWSEETWLYHLGKHPELKDFVHASVLIAEAVAGPSVVLDGAQPGIGQPTRVYYREIRRHQHFLWYVKVVCGTDREPSYVKTVFEESKPAYLVIQEKKYPEFKEIWRADNTTLY